ncbi:HpcH/HpaI aldolase/citrate lyase family protein [Nocardia huaxiensis]|uniref:CoA ester lyase n=1 Tax=Nocardia huaxiensis TaxID=2755382 RepID=A0A7D6VG09_9NOCA|nr:CoA ester lyase [Nocardia huaxiensis]QLY28770.1 CoA ester lyase [Nocardia huaxiensis]UFS97757.1 CoA ester lyase [Nocardia huaxiensis]
MRSALYVPGNRPELFAKALAGPADVVLLDLEDSVPLRDKDSARAAVSAWLRRVVAPGRIWVRVNPGPLGLADLRAVALPGVSVICLSKTESPEQVSAAAAAIREAEPVPGTIGLCPLLESAAALTDARAIAATPGVTRLQLGEADLCADLGMRPGADERELLSLRTAVVLASAAAGLAPPLAPVRTDFRDLETLRTSTEGLARLGFRGRACIHPSQIPIVNQVFTPSATELARARTLVARFEAAAGQVVLDDHGRMVDLAVIRQARRLLENRHG